MERRESVVKEFRLGDVAAQFVRYEAADGRSWPTVRAGRYYVKDAEECFIAGLRVDEIPVAREKLLELYLWAKENPRVLKNGNDE